MQEQALHPAPKPSRPSVSAAGATLRAKALPGIKRLFQEYGHWLIPLLPLVLLAWQPFGWTSHLWTRPNSPLVFQPLVPLLTLFLIASRRQDFADQRRRAVRRLSHSVPLSEYEETHRSRSFLGRLRARRKAQALLVLARANHTLLQGNVSLTVIGCLLMLVAYATQTPGLAVVSVVTVLVGAIFYAYGRAALIALAVPLLFLLTMIPPPEALMIRAEQTAQLASLGVVADLLGALGETPEPGPNVIHLGNYHLEVLQGGSGLAILVPALALTLWWLILRRTGFALGTMVLGVAVLAAMLVHIGHFVLAGLIGSKLGAMEFAKALENANSLLLLVPTLALIFFVGRAMGVGKPRAQNRQEYGGWQGGGGASAAPLSAQLSVIPAGDPTPGTAAAAAGASPGPTRLAPSSLRLAGIIAVTAFFGLFMNYRMARAGDWLPSLPFKIGVDEWSGTDAPLPESMIEGLGNPKTEGRIYGNPFGEVVIVNIVAANSFNAYHEPTVCSAAYGFYLKAEKKLAFSGKNTPVRAMMMRNDNLGARIIMYYWMQHRDGSTDIDRRMGNYRDIAARLRTGVMATVQGRQTCLVRVYAEVPQDDLNGAQTHRNVSGIAHTLYKTMREHGSEKPAGQKTAQARRSGAGKGT